MTGSTEVGSWHSEEYVAEWVGQDALAEMLTLPRQISAALVADAGIAVRRVVDLGSGPGAYLSTFLSAFPQARGVWVDSSEAMRDQALAQLDGFGDRVEYVVGDMEDLRGLGLGECDVILTSRAVHHFAHDSIQRLYASTLEMLTPGGFFFNLDHYGTPLGWEERYRRIRRQFTGVKRTTASHSHDVPFAMIEDHLTWLAAAGFEAPDVPWRTFFTALIAAQRAG